MKVIKVSGISGYNFGDKILSICLDKLFEYNNIDYSAFHIVPLKGNNITKEKYIQANKRRNRVISFILNCHILMYFRNLIISISNIRYYLNISRNDIVYYGGGNLISNANGSNYLFLSFLLSFLLRNKKFNLLFCGVGPFSYPYKLQLNFIYNNSNMIILRDNYSKSFFKNQNKIYVLPDPAILCSYFFPLNKNQEKKTFLVNLLDYSKFDSQLYAQISFKLIHYNISKIAKVKGLTPVFICTSISDMNYFVKFVEYYNDKECKRHELVNLNEIEHFKSYLEMAEFAIVNRMHAGIIISSYYIPTLFYPWQNKVNGFVEHLANENHLDFLIDEINFDADIILNKLNVISSKYNLKEIVEKMQSQLLEFNLLK